MSSGNECAKIPPPAPPKFAFKFPPVPMHFCQVDAFLLSVLHFYKKNSPLIVHQMMMTLKLMGLAFEVFDSGETSSGLEQKYRRIEPSLLDMFHYTFTHAGILTGKI